MVASTVLVTGASGFLGQHVMKHLQLYGTHLKEIRVLDLNPYEKKLEFDGSVPVRSYTGSIVDKYLVNEACKGVDCVFHVASLVDSKMFPNEKALDIINVKGTEIVVEACKANNVSSLIYCSSISVFVGYDEVKDGTETSVPVPHKLIFEKYGRSKYKAQEIALRANGDLLMNGKQLRTCAILPLPMYGELDQTMVYQYVLNTRTKGVMPRLGKMKARVQLSYVGNVAMMFVKAFETMNRGEDIGGEYFYAADDTPVDTVPELLRPYIEDSGCNFSSKWYIPLWLLAFICFLVYCVLTLVRLFKKVNTQLAFNGLQFMNHTFYVTYDKANTLLGYKPLYDVPSAIKESKHYYSTVFTRHSK